jgi:hypothetical protein
MNNNTALLKAKRLAIFNLIGLAVVIFINTLAATGLINHKTTAALSDQYPNYFVPAGQTFAIWGIIYLLLLAFCIYQLFVFARNKTQAIIAGEINSVNTLFLFTCILNIAWIFSWHYEVVWLSIIIMLIFLLTLIRMQYRLGIVTYRKGWKNVLFIQVPFAVYLGWIAIATIANATAVLVHYHWNGWSISQVNWTIIMIVIGTLISLLMIFRRQNIFFGAVVVWAYYGIVIKRLNIDAAQTISIIKTAEIGMGMVIIAILIQLFRKAS